MASKGSKTRKVFALFRKEFLLIIRNRRRLLQHLLLPILCILLHHFTIGRTPQNLRMGVFNLESNSKSCDNLSLLSCEMLSYIDKKYIDFQYFTVTIFKIKLYNNSLTINFKDWDECHKKGANGEVVGIMLISENMTLVFNSYGPTLRRMQDFKNNVKYYTNLLIK